jgi:hypothetical protein
MHRLRTAQASQNPEDSLRLPSFLLDDQMSSPTLFAVQRGSPALKIMYSLLL